MVKLVVDEEKAQRFPRLSKIIAEENFISHVSLSIRTLKELNLTNNVLSEVLSYILQKCGSNRPIY